MLLLKFVYIVAVLMAVSAHYDESDIIPLINAVNDVVLVQGSHTCVILVIENRIQFVSGELKSTHELKKCSNIPLKNLEIVKATFEPLSPLDILEKLERMASTRSTFLVYFTADATQRAGERPSAHQQATAERKKPLDGLLGLAKKALGVTISHKNLPLNVLDIKKEI